MKSDYQRVSTPNPHNLRTKQILAAHPEVKELFGNTPSSALHIVTIVAIQIALAVVLSHFHTPLWAIFLVAYLFGALANHALWVMIHECSHNLVFRSTAGNNLIAIVANLPFIFPSAVSFKKYHLFHHRYQGELRGDADLASPMEARVVGNSPLRKIGWLFFFFLVEGVVRPIRVKGVRLWCRWTILNTLVEFAFIGAMFWLFGWRAVAYLGMATFFSVGLHPVGARWIQEHYVFEDKAKHGQETFSYYGPINLINYNIGHHNEHHDLMMVPWSKLPKIRAMAPEFYDSIYFHTSYVKLLRDFIFDRKVSLFSRVVREDRSPLHPPGAKSAGKEKSRLNKDGITAEPALG